MSSIQKKRNLNQILLQLQLDVWQHGTGHGFGAFLSVHEGPHSFSSNIPLVPGHVITNEPCFCKFLFCFRQKDIKFIFKFVIKDLDGRYMRIEPALSVRKVMVSLCFSNYYVVA